MKLLRAAIALWALGLPGALRADSSRSSEPVDLSHLVLLRKLDKGMLYGMSPTGRSFAVFDRSVVRLFDVDAGREVQALSGHSGCIHDCGWSRDGRTIATSGLDGSVRIWEAATGKALQVLYPHAGYACSLAFSEDGKWLATGGSEDGLIKIYDVATGRLLLPISTADSTIYEMSFTPDGRYLVTAHATRPAADNTLRVFRTSNGAEAGPFASGLVSAFAVSRDGRTLAYSNPRGSLVLVETEKWTARRRWDGNSPGVCSIAFHRSGRFMACADRDGTVRIWDTDSAELVNSLSLQRQGDSRLVFASDGTSLVVSGAEGSTRVYGRPPLRRLTGGRAPESGPDRAPENAAGRTPAAGGPSKN